MRADGTPNSAAAVAMACSMLAAFTVPSRVALAPLKETHGARPAARRFNRV
jgi:hypothetical protein